jgi:ferredoxin
MISDLAIADLKTTFVSRSALTPLVTRQTCLARPPAFQAADEVRIQWRYMPKLTVDGYGTFDVVDGKRLVLAIEQDAKVDILHACGGNARCTTCRVEFVEGEPERFTVAEKEKLTSRALTGIRLSCQILCDHDMTVRAISRLEGSGRADPGPTPEEAITPPAVWA